MGNIAIRALAAPFKLFNAISDEIAKDRRLFLTDGPAWARFFGQESAAGKFVTVDSALQLAAAWACIRVTAQAVASLPLVLYERGRDGSRTRVEDELADVLAESPNQDQTGLEYWESVVAWLATHGNAYSERTDGARGRLVALGPPMPAHHCVPFRNDEGELAYRVVDRGQVEILPREKVFHVKGFGQSLKNVDLGLSPISAGVQSIGAAMAATEAAAGTFANGMRPTGFFLFDQQLTKEQREQANKSLVDPLRGSGKAGGIGILEAGVKWQSVSMNPEDAQMLETRRFDIEEICRWFGVPPIIIGHSAEGQTMWGSGVEQIILSWLILGIDPICDRIEARIRKQLIRPTGDRRRYAQFNREALLQIDAKTKAELLSSLVQNGLLTRNEGRTGWLNLDRKDGADELTVQTNLAPLATIGKAQPGAEMIAALRAMLAKADDQEETHDVQA